MGRLYEKSVNAVAAEPFLHIVGDLDWRSFERALATRAGETLVELADRQPLLARPAGHLKERGLAIEPEIVRDLGQRAVDIAFRQVEPAERVRQQYEPDIRMDLRLQEAVLFLGLFGGAAGDDVETWHDFQRLGRSSVFGHAPLQVAVEFLSDRKRVLRREHPLGDACR